MDSTTAALNSDVEAALELLTAHAKARDSYIDAMQQAHALTPAQAAAKWRKDLDEKSAALKSAFRKLKDHIVSQDRNEDA